LNREWNPGCGAYALTGCIVRYTQWCGHDTPGIVSPAIYFPPNYKRPGAQIATIDDSPAANEEEKKELQSVIGTLLYYSRTVDPSILTAVHELGSNQAKPTIMDMWKMERVLQYLSTHKNYGVRYYASNMQLQGQSDASYLS
jgi:hypothetical protein